MALMTLYSFSRLILVVIPLANTSLTSVTPIGSPN
jgi:hypothetical protein